MGKKCVYYVADTESYTEDNSDGHIQEETYVTAIADLKVGFAKPRKNESKDELLERSIEKYINEDNVGVYSDLSSWLYTMRDRALSEGSSIVVYFYNLKWDGEFIVNALRDIANCSFVRKKEELNLDSFTYSIGDNNIWYSISWKVGQGNSGGIYITFLDLQKLAPGGVRALGEGFCTKYRKLETDYTKFDGSDLDEEQIRYLKHDVLVIGEVLLILMRSEFHYKGTLGRVAVDDFRKRITDRFGKGTFEFFFPKLNKSILRYKFRSYKPGISEKLEDDYEMTIDDFCRKAYSGSLCYVNEGIIGTTVYREGTGRHGVTVDCNSMYMSVMMSDNGNIGPLGEGKFPIGEGIHLYNKSIFDKKFGFYLSNSLMFEDNGLNSYFSKKSDRNYIILHFEAEFDLKENHIPTLKTKDYAHSKSKPLKTSKGYIDSIDRYTKNWVFKNGGKETEVKATAELWLTEDDFELFLRQYDVHSIRIIDMHVFDAYIGLFDDYGKHWGSVKEEATKSGNKPLRQIAKCMLTNLYGKFGSKPSRSFKTLDGGDVSDESLLADSDPSLCHVATAAAIISKGKVKLVDAIQKNYMYFLYCDTDSLHLACTEDEIVGLDIDNIKIGSWKIESIWTEARFLRQKTYVERVIDSEHPYPGRYQLKCAGLSSDGQKFFEGIINGDRNVNLTSEAKRKFYRKYICRDMEDIFKYGTVIPGCLKEVKVIGGPVLVERAFELKPVAGY